MKTFTKESSAFALVILSIVLFVSGEYMASTLAFSVATIALNIKAHINLSRSKDRQLLLD